MGRRLRDARIGSRGSYSLEDDSDDDRHDGEVDDHLSGQQATREVCPWHDSGRASGGKGADGEKQRVDVGYRGGFLSSPRT